MQSRVERDFTYLKPFVKYSNACPAWTRAWSSRGAGPRNRSKTALVSCLLFQGPAENVLRSLRVPGVITAEFTGTHQAVQQMKDQGDPSYRLICKVQVLQVLPFEGAFQCRCGWSLLGR